MLVFVPVFAGINYSFRRNCLGRHIQHDDSWSIRAFCRFLPTVFLLPILSVTVVLAVSGSVFPNVSVESIVKLIKKLITWGMTVAMTLFTGFTTMKCTLAAKTDGAAAKQLNLLFQDLCL